MISDRYIQPVTIRAALNVGAVILVITTLLLFLLKGNYDANAVRIIIGMMNINTLIILYGVAGAALYASKPPVFNRMALVVMLLILLLYNPLFPIIYTVISGINQVLLIHIITAVALVYLARRDGWFWLSGN